MKDLELFLFELGLGGGFVACILFVIFGQVTVRKLRKNLATKGKLGVEFMSGYDIFNVASSLSSPKWLRDKLSRSPLSFLSADYETLYEHTNLFDRILGRSFWLLCIASTSILMFLVILNAFGSFD